MQCEGECAHRESGLHLFFQYKNRYEWRGDTVREQLKNAKSLHAWSSGSTASSCVHSLEFGTRERCWNWFEVRKDTSFRMRGDPPRLIDDYARCCSSKGDNNERV